MSNLFFNNDPGTIATNDPGGLFDGAEGIFGELFEGVTDIFKSRDARKLEERRIAALTALNSPAFGGDRSAGTGTTFGGSAAGGGLTSFQVMSLGFAAVGLIVAVLALRK